MLWRKIFKIILAATLRGVAAFCVIGIFLSILLILNILFYVIYYSVLCLITTESNKSVTFVIKLRFLSFT